MSLNSASQSKLVPSSDTSDNSTPECGQREPIGLERWALTSPELPAGGLVDFPKTSFIPSGEVEKLLEEVELAYHDFCLDMTVLTDFSESGISALRAWYGCFLILRQEALVASDTAVLRFLLSTRGQSTINYSEGPKDWENAWYAIIEEIMIGRLRAGYNTGCQRRHRSEGTSYVGGQQTEPSVTIRENTNFIRDKNPDLSRSNKRRRLRTSNRHQVPREEEPLHQRVGGLAAERYEQDSEICLLKAENKRLKEELEKFKTVIKQFRALMVTPW